MAHDLIVRLLASGLLFVVACSDPTSAPIQDATVSADAGPTESDTGVDPSDAGGEDATEPRDGVSLLVTLDGNPEPGVLVVQGGTLHEWRTNSGGRVQIEPDLTVVGEIVLIASHPDARIRGTYVDSPTATIALARFDRSGNMDYAFQDPGEPTRRNNTAQCGHCHQTINDDWFGSPHRTAASNPHLRSIYSDVKALDPTGFGGCADCHAPGMNGALSGRDLDDASQLALDYGVHCDVCHRVENVDESSVAPAFGGWFAAVRPTEEGSPALGAGGLLPITFGPSHDSPNVRMGSVQRDHFREARFCGGCHQLEQAELAGPIDRTRWPSGRLPVHTTFEEWRAGALVDVAPCQACHMPPAPDVANSGDLQRFELATVGIQGGWYRAPGSVRRHSFVGPRTPSSGLLELSGAVFIEKAVAGGVLTATVKVRNAGAGHALPTGEPLRSVLLLVDADCGGTGLTALGGDAVPSFGGYLERKSSGDDWNAWTDPEVGDQVRVVRQGPHVDYQGFGPFGDGTFDAVQKNLRSEEVVGTATVTGTAPITYDVPLPAGDVAYLVRTDASAGRPGFAFARVMTDASGEEMVPHFSATDVMIDNRLLPHQSWTTTHIFASPCSDPAVTARLVWRRFPLRVARARGWDPGDRLIMEARR